MWLQDDVAIIWLSDPSQTATAVAALNSNKLALGIDQVIYGQDLINQGLFAGNGHGPDIIVKVGCPGVAAAVSMLANSGMRAHLQ